MLRGPGLFASDDDETGSPAGLPVSRFWGKRRDELPSVDMVVLPPMTP